MDDQAALQEAIQRARQLAAKITQSAPVKRTAPSDHSGPVKVTLAYEKPANSEPPPKHHDHQDRPDRQERQERPDRPDRSDRLDRNDRHDHHDHHDHQVRPSSDDHNTERDKQKIELIIPHAVIGLVIGKGGENIKRIQNETGATVRVDPNTVDEKGNKLCTITGTKQAIDDAHVQVTSMIENSATNKRPRLQVDNKESYRMKIPAQRTGAIIGKGGETIKSIKQQSGCDIELDKLAKDSSHDETVFVIRGTADKILKARQLIEARLAQGRGGGRDGPRDHNNDHNHSNPRSGPKNVATGANAAPVAPYTDLPSAAGQQIPNTTTDMAAAWAAYYAQYQVLAMNQAQPQPQSQPAAPMMPYAGQQAVNQQVPQLNHSQQPVAAASISTPMEPTPGANGGSQPDYTAAWVEYYIQNNRPDYAQKLIEMKKQSQQNQQLNDNF